MTAAGKIVKPSPPLASYEGDCYSWLIEQATPLDAGDVQHADLPNTGLAYEVFPVACPYSVDEIMTREIAWPPQD